MKDKFIIIPKKDLKFMIKSLKKQAQFSDEGGDKIRAGIEYNQVYLLQHLIKKYK